MFDFTKFNAELKKIEEKLNSEKKYRNNSFENLISSWKNFVSELEKGYQASIDDYILDINMRDVIQDYLENVSTDLKEKLLFEIKNSDQLFIEFTDAIKDAPTVIRHLNYPSEKFWFYRKPKKLSEYLSIYF